MSFDVSGEFASAVVGEKAEVADDLEVKGEAKLDPQAYTKQDTAAAWIKEVRMKTPDLQFEGTAEHHTVFCTWIRIK